MDASGKVQSRFALQKMMQIIKLTSWFGCFFDEALQKEDEEFLSSFSSKVSRSFTPNEREMSKDNFDPENKEGPREADEKEDLCGDLSTVHDHLHLFEEDLESSVRVFSLGHFEKGECPVPSACGRGQGIFHYPPPLHGWEKKASIIARAPLHRALWSLVKELISLCEIELHPGMDMLTFGLLAMDCVI